MEDPLASGAAGRSRTRQNQPHDAPHPLRIERARAFAQPAVDGAGEDVEQQLDVDALREVAAPARALEHAAGRRAMTLANLGATRSTSGIAALGDQGADDAAAGRGRAQRRRGHERGVQIALEPARLDRAAAASTRFVSAAITRSARVGQRR